ncbi:MAG: 3-dehydroquinate synthase [Tannerellaceae bacterium]|jgi:3-dehydroquinate synthase|nr:3-dehydroquinate synthase [Tannerellaceae bacterium]
MSARKLIISNDLRTDLENFLATLTYDKLFVLTDTNTKEKCYPLIRDIPPLQAARLICIPPGDRHKNMEQLSAVWQILSSEGASRSSLLINLGGGMITDLGGFAGATFKRGLQTLHIPTTLMAAVDAAVGGKTGINFNGLKNEIGAFYPPVGVFIDCDFLRTLDRENLLSGYAEMIKHALLSSMEMYNPVLSFDWNQPIDYELLSQMAAQSVAIKERIAEEDPKEKGIRKALNLGHTVGHAMESLSFENNTPLLHGHAVAAGIICELYLSYKQCNFPSDKLTRTTYYIKEYYPPFFFDCKAYDRLYERMTHDKKNENGVINFTLLSDVGRIHINRSVHQALLFESLDFYRESFGI